MDILKYAEKKAKGKASIVKHGVSTLLVSIDGEDRGYQPFDIEAAIASLGEGNDEAIAVVRADVAAVL